MTHLYPLVTALRVLHLGHLLVVPILHPTFVLWPTSCLAGIRGHCALKVVLFWISIADCLLCLVKAVLGSPVRTQLVPDSWDSSLACPPGHAHGPLRLRRQPHLVLRGSLLGSEQGWVCVPSPYGASGWDAVGIWTGTDFLETKPEKQHRGLFIMRM